MTRRSRPAAMSAIWLPLIVGSWGHTHFFGASLESSAVDEWLPACPAIGIDFDSSSLDIVPLGLVAALSLAVSAGFIPVGDCAGIAGGVLAAGGGAVLETEGETSVAGGGDALSPQATSAAVAVTAISR